MKAASPEKRAERFWAKATRPAEGCWEWQFSKNIFGYGKVGWVREDGKHTCAAHRIAWELTHGPIPAGLFVCHRCNNKACIRPDHLYLATDAENKRDAIRDGLFTGAHNQPSKLTPDQVREIRRINLEEGLGHRRLAKRFGMSRGAILMIIRNRAWKKLLPQQEAA